MNIDEKEYKIAFSEVDDILYFTDRSVVSQIPESFIRFIRENKEENYISKINPYMSLDEQDVSSKAKAIIALIYRSYIASDKEKEVFELKDKKEFEKIENEKREKYNPDEIFKNIKQEIETEEIHTESMEDLSIEKSLDLVHKNIFEKIIIEIKYFFKKMLNK